MNALIRCYPTYGFTFVEMPKAASQSVRKVLVERFGSCPHRGVRDEEFTFSICRNPYDRAASIWWATTKRGDDRYGIAKDGGKTLEGMLEFFLRSKLPPKDQHGPYGGKWGLIANQSQNVGDLNIDRFLRFEDLEREWASLPFMDGVKLPHINTTHDLRDHWTQYMTPEAIGLVHEWADEDFTRFGYERLADA